MSGHTPGPWYALGTAVHPDLKGLDQLARIARCEVRRSVPVITGPQAQANARLIASAPDLLHALKVYIRQHQHGEGCVCTSCKQAEEIAAEAIAKAEGR